MRKLMSPGSVSFTAGTFLLRVAFGVTMLVGHGVGKIERLLDDPTKFSDPVGLGPVLTLGLAVFGEAICSMLLILGLFTRWAALFNAVTMAIAAFIVHSGDPFVRKELALVYLAAYLTIFFIGPGKWSLDSSLYGGRRRY